MAEHEESTEHGAAHESHGGHPANPLDPKELFGHVEDAPSFHLPQKLAPAGSHGHVEIPQPFEGKVNYQVHTSSDLLNRTIQPFDLKITKFMVIELLVAIL